MYYKEGGQTSYRSEIGEFRKRGGCRAVWKDVRCVRLYRGERGSGVGRGFQQGERGGRALHKDTMIPKKREEFISLKNIA